MLMVTELIEVAQGRRSPSVVRSRAAGRFDRTRAPVVVWNVCSHCNMHCPHCYAAAGARPSRQDLSERQCLDLLERLAEGGVQVVIFSGGEPLLRADLIRLIGRATELGLSAHLSTNGLFLDPDRVAMLRDAGLGYVGVSIDGREELNDSYRGIAGGFQQAVDGLRNAEQAGLRTGLRMTITRRNADHLEDLVQLAASLRLDRFYVSHLVPTGRARSMTVDALSGEQTRAVLLRLFALAEDCVSQGSRLSVATGANDSDGVLLLYWIGARYGASAAEKVEQLLCARRGNSAGEGVLCIDPQGKVHPDPFWRSVVVGNLCQQSVRDVLEHPLLQSLRRRETLLEGRCGGCDWKGLCRGSHRGRAEVATGLLWGSDPLCVLTDAEVGVHPAVVVEV